ncbi:50S ribosomal protein L19 [Candidatus Microgenomates bacterium]|nr:50S ribosomal protein L19 [Candidatus Microgenomates bacterium]
MANSFNYQDKTYNVSDTLDVVYRIKEGEKERQQKFTGMLLQIRGKDEGTRMITVRKITRSGIGVERIIPLSSPFIASIALAKKGNYQKAKAYFVRGLSDQQLRRKIYRRKSV